MYRILQKSLYVILKKITSQIRSDSVSQKCNKSLTVKIKPLLYSNLTVRLERMEESSGIRENAPPRKKGKFCVEKDLSKMDLASLPVGLNLE